ncbi:MAG: hypothetical protein CMK07_12025 [Ponticaulis sp.]|nr:hypothetical protein [Ponticaulis sp.]
MRNCKYLSVFAGLIGLCACTTSELHDASGGILGEDDRPSITADDVPSLYRPPVDEGDARCLAILDELTRLYTALGGPATDSPADTDDPSIMDRIGTYGRDFVIDTATGYVRPVIQVKRTLMNDDEKDRKLLRAIERGITRRAYLIGLADGIPCDFAPVVEVVSSSSEPAVDDISSAETN